MSDPKQVASFLMTMLGNVNDLIIKSNDRNSAQDVLRAFEIYADNNGFPVAKDLVSDFHSIIRDAQNYTLSSLVKDIASDIEHTEKKLEQEKRKNKRDLAV